VENDGGSLREEQAERREKFVRLRESGERRRVLERGTFVCLREERLLERGTLCLREKILTNVLDKESLIERGEILAYLNLWRGSFLNTGQYRYLIERTSARSKDWLVKDCVVRDDEDWLVLQAE